MEVRGHGKAVAKSWPLKERGISLESFWLLRVSCGIAHRLLGNCPEILWMIHRMLPGHQAGHHSDHFVDANLSAS